MNLQKLIIFLENGRNKPHLQTQGMSGSLPEVKYLQYPLLFQLVCKIRMDSKPQLVFELQTLLY